MLFRHGPPSDFGLYHAIAIVWEAGQGNDDTRHRRYSALCSSSPLPLLVKQRSLGSQVARAAARYLDHTQADPLLAASAARDMTHFLRRLLVPNLEMNLYRLLVANPRHPSSKGNRWTVHPQDSMSNTVLFTECICSFFPMLNNLPSLVRQ